MGKLTGAVLVVAGVTIAAYAMAERQRMAADSTVAVPRTDKTDAAKTAAAETAAAETGAAPGSGPKLEARADSAKPGTQQPPAALAATPTPAAEASPEPKALVLDGKSAQAPLKIAEAPPRVPVDHNKPARTVPIDPEGLTKAIQHHLRRVGCYAGPISGDWTPAVRQAMKTFTERVNATLPLEAPDAVLLALLQNHKAPACGAASCPAGQAKDDSGTCQPNAVIARTKRSNAAPGDAAVPTTASTGTPEERTTTAGPQPPQKRAARRRSRYWDARARERRRAPGSGTPWWAGPVFSP